MTRASASGHTGKPHGHLVDLLGKEIVAGVHESKSDTLTDMVLKERFEVSRSSIREALLILSSKGMIDRRKHRGTVVRQRQYWDFLDADVLSWLVGEEKNSGVASELLEMRLMVEPFAARAAAFARTHSDLMAVEGAIRSLRSFGTGDVDRQVAVVDIHRAVLRASGNRLIERLINVVDLAIGRGTRHLVNRPDDLRATLKSYDGLLEAIRKGDGELAFVTMTQIVRASGKALPDHSGHAKNCVAASGR